MTYGQDTRPELVRLRPPRNRVHRRTIGWWATRSGIGTVIGTAIPSTVHLLVAPARPWLAPLIVVVALVGIGHTAVVPWWRYSVHRWETTTEAVYARSGWFVREWRVAPISRIQTVDTTRGPLQQLFGLATVTVTTASAHGPVALVGLDADVAARTARELTAVVQRTHGDAT